MKITDPNTFRNNIKTKLNKIIRRKKLSLNLEKGNIDLTPETITLDWYEKLEKLNKKNSDLAINNKMLAIIRL